jgi:hypothetical protein
MERAIRDPIIIPTITGHLQYALDIHLPQLENVFGTLSIVLVILDIADDLMQRSQPATVRLFREGWLQK